MMNPLTTETRDPVVVRALLEEAQGRSRSPLDRSIMRALLDYGPDRCDMYAILAEPGGVLQAFPNQGARQDAWFLARGAALIATRSSSGRPTGVFVAEPGYAGGQHACLPEFSWPPRVDAFARCLSASAAVVLPDASERRIVAEPGNERLASQLDLAERLRRWAPALMARLRQFAAFRHATQAELLDLLGSGEPARLEAGTPIATCGRVPDRSFVLLSGAVSSTVPPEGAKGATMRGGGSGIERNGRPGEVIAFPPFAARAPSLSDDVTTEASTGIWIDVPNLAAQYEAHPRAARATDQPFPRELLPCALVLPPRHGGHAELAAAATRLAAAYLAAEFNDLVLLVRPTAESGEPEIESTPIAPGVYRARFPTGAPEEFGANRHKLASLFLEQQAKNGRPAGLILIEPDVDPGLLRKVAPLVCRVFELTETPVETAPEGFELCRHQSVCLLPPLDRPSQHIWPARSVRVRWDPAEVVRHGSDFAWVTGPGAEGSAGARGVRRLGRALSERLVGLALGGGGTPGFAHISLLRAFRAHAPEMPIDMVAGTSIGSLVGAWFAGNLAMPREEDSLLDSLLQQGGWLNVIMPIAMVNSRVMELWMNRAFPGLNLSQLEVPFSGVSTDVMSATAWVTQHGTLGGAMRNSSAFSPIFPPIQTPGALLVDGGFGDNVPVAMVRALGASYVIGSNAVGVPNTLPSSERPGGPTRRALGALNPFARVRAALDAGFVLFHRLGDFECKLANLSFEAAYSGDRFWDFSRGEEIVTTTKEDAVGFALHAHGAWAGWSRRRHTGAPRANKAGANEGG